MPNMRSASLKPRRERALDMAAGVTPAPKCLRLWITLLSNRLQWKRRRTDPARCSRQDFRWLLANGHRREPGSIGPCISALLLVAWRRSRRRA